MTTREELLELRRLAKAAEELERIGITRKYGVGTSPSNEVAREISDAELARTDDEISYAINGTTLNLRKLFSAHPVWTWVGDGNGATDPLTSKVVIESSMGLARKDRNESRPSLYVSAMASSNNALSIGNVAHRSLTTDTRVYTGLTPVSVSITVTTGVDAELTAILGLIRQTLHGAGDEWRWRKWIEIGSVSVSILQSAHGPSSANQDRRLPKQESTSAVGQVNFIVFHQWMISNSPRPGANLKAQAIGLSLSEYESEGEGVDGRIPHSVNPINPMIVNGLPDE